MPHSTRNRLATFALLVSLAALSATAIADDASSSSAPAAAATVLDAGAPPGPDAQPLPHETLPTVDQPGAVLQAVTDAKSHGGFIAMGMIVLYVIAAWLMKLTMVDPGGKPRPLQAWFAKGRRLVILTSLVGVLAALVDHFGGAADGNTVIAAVATGVGKFLVPIHA